jgi:hypothetical protein
MRGYPKLEKIIKKKTKSHIKKETGKKKIKIMPEQTNNIEMNFPSNCSFLIIFMKNICTKKLPRKFISLLSFQSHISLNDIIKKKFGQIEQKYRKRKTGAKFVDVKKLPEKNVIKMLCKHYEKSD